MEIPTLLRYALGVAGAATLFVGCNSGGSSSSVPGNVSSASSASSASTAGRLLNTLPASQRHSVVARILADLSRGPHGAFHPHRVGISHNAKGAPRLLFVGNSSDTVGIYVMPEMAEINQVTGFALAEGECEDSGGNVWVTDGSAHFIVQLMRNGSVGTILADSYGAPVGCSWDPTTGNLAVANAFGTFGMGNVVIYAGGTGSGTTISNPAQFIYISPAYDNSGNLLVSGLTSGSTGIISRCPSGTSSCTTVTLSGNTIYSPGWLQWARGLNEWYIQDAMCGNVVAVCWYPVSTSGDVGSANPLEDSDGITVCDAGQGVITNARSRVLAGGVDDSSCGGTASLNRWMLAKGGMPTHHVSFTGTPSGAAISHK